MTRMPDRRPGPVTVEQVLHGYADGHQQLAASVDLPRHARTEMLLMSDLSGPGVRQGFESYLTGYPLPEAKMYAFARTWYAAEMPRPGCVWTHTLLLREDDVRELRDLSTLLTEFRRPKDGHRFDDYGKSLEVSATSGHSKVARERIRALLQPLYVTPARTVAVSATESTEWEPAVLAIWSQQWPELRRSFRFCTGCLAPRQEGMDVEVFPNEIERHYRKNGDQYAWAEPAPNSDTLDGPWLSMAVGDAEGDGAELRRFLWDFGPEHIDGRAAFRPIVDIFAHIRHGAPSDQTRWAEYLSLIVGVFPSPTVAPRLKQKLFGAHAATTSLGTSTDEVGLLAEVARNADARALDPDTLGIRVRSREALRADTAATLTISAELDLDTASKCCVAFLQGVIDGLQANPKMLDTAPVRPLLKLLQFDRSLGATPTLWKRPLAERRQLLERAAWILATPDSRSAAVRALLEAGATDFASEVVASFGDVAVEAALLWYSERGPAEMEVPDAWLEVFARFPGPLAALLASPGLGHGGLLWIAALCLDPHSSVVRKVEMSRWKQVYDALQRSGVKRNEERAASFLFALAFGSADRSASAAAASVFPILYAACERDDMSQTAWSLLEDLLPGFRWDWDRCKRLVRGFAQRAVASNWDYSDFVIGLGVGDSLERGLKYAKRSWDGWDYVEGLCRSAREGKLEASPSQLKSIRKICE